jgi:hypothetical protein
MDIYPSTCTPIQRTVSCGFNGPVVVTSTAKVLNLINIFSLTENDERQIRDELFGVHR